DLTRDGGLLLGRAGAVVLAHRPRTYHIRLDGPAERRLARATGIEDIDIETARKRLTETDRTRTLFVKRLYRTDPADPALYHLVLDTTVLTLDGALAVLVAAASDFFAAG
ncbi:MAG: AAA family ATPase, partial [Acidimicrobiales bacterium]